MPRTYAAVRAGGGAAIGAKDRPDHLSAASDQQVVAWAKQGHEAAFRELVRRYERPEFKFSSWIFKIANNAAIDHLRKKSLDTLSLDGSPSAETPEQMRATSLQLGDRAETPLAEVESRELGTAIERAIGRLRPEYRSCILLRHVEGYTYEEIAETLALPLGTVKTYIHRARNELRVYLEDRRE